MNEIALSNDLTVIEQEIYSFHELGIRTIRYTNDEVEEMLTRRLKRLDETGELSEFFKQ